MSTTDTRAAFEAWMREEYGADDDMLKRPYEDRYFWPRAADAWAGWQAATEAAKAEKLNDDQPAMYCAPDKNGKPLFGKGWMFSPVPQMEATMPLYARPAAKATGTAGEQKPKHAGWVDEFGNVWPLGAYSVDGKPNFHDAHKRNWKPLYTHPAPTLAHVDSNIFDLIHEWAAKPEGNRHDAARAIIGSVNKSYSAGVADGRALAEAARQPAPVADQLKLICAGFGWRTDGDSNVLADRIEHHIRDLKAGIKARDTVIAERDAAMAATAAPVLSDEQINRMAGRNGLYAAMTPDDRTCKSMVKRFVTEILDATRSQP